MRIKAVAALVLLSVSMLAFTFNIQLASAQPDPDLNGDGTVNIKDVAIAASAFGSYPGHERYNSDADMDLNERIDIKDLFLICRSIG